MLVTDVGDKMSPWENLMYRSKDVITVRAQKNIHMSILINLINITYVSDNLRRAA